jgi:hypothetical protein
MGDCLFTFNVNALLPLQTPCNGNIKREYLVHDLELGLNNGKGEIPHELLILPKYTITDDESMTNYRSPLQGRNTRKMIMR